MTAVAAHHAEKPAPPRKTVLSGIFNVVFGFFLFVLGSIIVSVLVEWVRMLMEGGMASHSHSAAIYQLELSATHYYISKGFIWGQALFDQMETVLVDFHRTALTINAASFPDEAMYLTTEMHIMTLSEYLKAACYTLMTVLLRTINILLATPIFLIAMLVGLTDGLVARELRIWGGGRESSDKYKIGKSLIFPSYLVCWIAYLSYPNYINQMIFIMPSAFAVGYFSRMMMLRFKKYF